jgi:hypothetical protein
MPARCGFELNLREERERCARWLASEYDYIHDHPPVDEVAAFADLPRDDEGNWQCPRTAVADGRCVLHHDDSTDDEVRATIVAALRGEYDADEFAVEAPDGDRRTFASRFLGVELGTLDLHGWRGATRGAAALDLRCAEIDAVRLGDAAVDAPIRLAGATLGSIEATDAELGGSIGTRFATVEGDLRLDRATVDGRVDCRFSRIGGEASVRHATADSRFDFGFSHVGGTVAAAGGNCGGRFTLKEAVVDAVAAEDVAVSGPDPESDIPGLQFRGLTARGSVDLTGADCEGKLIGYRMAIGGTSTPPKRRSGRGSRWRLGPERGWARRRSRGPSRSRTRGSTTRPNSVAGRVTTLPSRSVSASTSRGRRSSTSASSRT